MPFTPPDHSAWTQRDIEILETLTLKVRILTLRQIADEWWSTSNESLLLARRRMLRLVRAGLVDRYQLNIHPLLPLREPIVAWAGGDTTPDFSKVAWKLKSRWTMPAMPTSVFFGSKHAANLFGGFGGSAKDPIQATHDVHLTHVYLWYREHKPWFAESWIGEDAVRKAPKGIKNPDAFLRGIDGRFTRVIDFGGKYSSDRVRDFHRYCEQRRLPYELW